MWNDAETIRCGMSGVAFGLIACQTANAATTASVAGIPADGRTPRHVSPAIKADTTSASINKRPSGPTLNSVNLHPLRVPADVARIFWQEPSFFY